MVQATGFHEGMHVDFVDIYDASDNCPVCSSRQPRQAAFRIQLDPPIDMLACPSCGASSASHMPKPELLDRYYARYYASASDAYTFNDPKRFARHLLRFMPDFAAASSVRILDFGGGDGSLAIAMAEGLRTRGSSSMTVTIDVVDYAAPRHASSSTFNVRGHTDLSEVQGSFDIILASAILEHIPDAHAAIRKLTSMAGKGSYMYARTPFILPLARLIRRLDITYPAHVHDMGSNFWNKFIQTFDLRARLLSSRPSLVETTLRKNPARTLVAHALKLPAFIELALLGRNRSPRWEFVGGWEIVMRFD